MDASGANVMCPVCTLYLRPGITLKAHLTSHPKQKVIEALVSLSTRGETDKRVAIVDAANGVSTTVASSSSATQQPTATIDLSVPANGGSVWPTTPQFAPVPAANHAIIYQQFMSTTSQPPAQPIPQQYIIPTMFNPQQLMCQPYMYQQQQVIMSTGMTMPAPLAAAMVSRKPQITDLTGDDDVSSLGLVEEIKDDFELKDDEDEKKEDMDVVNDEIQISECQEEHRADATDTFKSSTCDVDKHELNFEDVDKEECFEPDEDKSELDKACQTAPALCSNELVDSTAESSEAPRQDNDNDKDNVDIPPMYYRLDATDEKISEEEALSIVLQQQQQQQQQQHHHQSDVVASDQVIDMDGMQLVLCNDFMSGQMISQVDDFECISNRGGSDGGCGERTVLMNIGGMDGACGGGMEQLADESVSHESTTNLSIRADEHMPPRGELSGQESNGAASDVAWNSAQYESNSSVSCGLLARETWEGSDCSDVEAPLSPGSHVPMRISRDERSEDEDDPDVDVNGGDAGPSMYEHNLPNLKRENVETAAVPARSGEGSSALVGSRLGTKRPVKKLTIKSIDIKPQNFNNIFASSNRPSGEAMDIGGERIAASCLVNVKSEEENVSVTISTKNDDGGSSGVLKEKTVGSVLCCLLCKLPFPDVQSMKAHKLQVHGRATAGALRYKCDTCSENMLTERNFNEHLKIHPLECRMCGKYFYRRQNLQLHVKRHLGIKPYSCEFCEKTFLTKQKLDEHKNTHTGDSPIKCTMCDETFKRHSNLIQHRNRHHLKLKRKVKDYVCFCGEIMHSKKKFAWHKEIHDPKPKACSFCSEKFVHMASLTRHMRRAHNGRFVPDQQRDNENIECPICKGVYLKASLDAHVRTHSGVRPYSCSICNKDFTTKWNLKLHKWTHAGRALKPFKCEQCSHAFIRESDYVAHVNSHKSIRPYTCNYCGAQFIRKYNCQRHVKEHEKEKPFVCKECGKAFHRSYYLKDHMRIHTGVRPFTCHICGKTSTTKSNHNKHVLIHHAKEPVSTEN